jgi:hypothetical protein
MMYVLGSHDYGHVDAPLRQDFKVSGKLELTK